MNNIQEKQRNEPKKIKYLIFAGLALVGVVDSFYLTLIELTHKDAFCSLIEGCDVVLKSQYATIGPIPTALLGLIYYLFLFFGVLMFLGNRSKDNILRALSFVVVIGFIFTLYFVFIQLFILNAICIYCMTSALITTILAIFGITFIKDIHRKQRNLI